MIARPLPISRADRRSDARLRACHVVDLTPDLTEARAGTVSLPITRKDVGVIASTGFPLWEPLDALQLRNHRITLAYGDLSHQLARLIAGSDDVAGWDANWCTFATWSSKTIGTCIDREPEHRLIHTLVGRFPRPVRSVAAAASEELLNRGNGVIYRTLALGNRLVFLEVGTAESHFLERFGTTAGESDRPDFDTYWSEVQTFLSGLSRLDPSWVATSPPDPATLQSGMRSYHAALDETDPKARAELVLLGNLLLGAYEQTRVEGYLMATLSFFTTSWLHRLMRGPRPGSLAVVARGVEAPLSTVYAIFATRFFLALEVPTADGMAELRVGNPLPPVDGDRFGFPALLQHIANPELQAVLTCYDLSDGHDGRTRAFNWADFADRMNYITNLFRSRQRDRSLFRSPWTEEEQASLLAGRLPSEAGTTNDPRVSEL